MSKIEIPEEAVIAAVAAATDQDYDAFPVRITSNRVAHMLSAVYPSIRCQVLESVVEDVAKIGVGDDGWKILNESERESRCRGARVVLGLEGEVR